MNNKSDLIDVSLHWHGETAKAIKVSEDGRKDGAMWLPKSQIEFERNGEEVTVTMPEWLAEDKGLI